MNNLEWVQKLEADRKQKALDAFSLINAAYESGRQVKITVEYTHPLLHQSFSDPEDITSIMFQAGPPLR